MIFSPFSVFHALSLVFEGAEGETAKQFQTALHFPQKKETLAPFFVPLDSPLLQTASGVWIRKGYQPREEYLNRIRKTYRAELGTIDPEKPSETLEEINSWFREKTAGNIPSILKTLDPQTSLLLGSAVHFHGKWLFPFKKEKTMEKPFTLTDGTSKSVPTMSFHGNFDWAPLENCQVLELPFEKRAQSLILFLPKEGVDDQEFLNGFDEKQFDKWDKKRISVPANLSLPCFEADSEFSVVPALRGNVII